MSKYVHAPHRYPKHQVTAITHGNWILRLMKQLQSNQAFHRDTMPLMSPPSHTHTHTQGMIVNPEICECLLLEQVQSALEKQS